MTFKIYQLDMTDPSHSEHVETLKGYNIKEMLDRLEELQQGYSEDEKVELKESYLSDGSLIAFATTKSDFYYASFEIRK